MPCTRCCRKAGQSFVRFIASWYASSMARSSFSLCMKRTAAQYTLRKGVLHVITFIFLTTTWQKLECWAVAWDCMHQFVALWQHEDIFSVISNSLRCIDTCNHSYQHRTSQDMQKQVLTQPLKISNQNMSSSVLGVEQDNLTQTSICKASCHHQCVNSTIETYIGCCRNQTHKSEPSKNCDETCMWRFAISIISRINRCSSRLIVTITLGCIQSWVGLIRLFLIDVSVSMDEIRLLDCYGRRNFKVFVFTWRLVWCRCIHFAESA